MFESPIKFMLVENFTWLINNLIAFVDPQYTYAKKGLPSVVGGARRMYRSSNHQQYYDYQKTATVNNKGYKNVKFPSGAVECEEWTVTHDTFSDPKLKEKYDAAAHVCLVTSRRALQSKKAGTRYYISCTCQDFRTTAEEKLVGDGYCLPQNPVLPPSTGKKKLESMPCKHLYTILMKEYQDIISDEAGPDPSADISGAVIHKPTPTPLPPPVKTPKDPTPDMPDDVMKVAAAQVIIRSLTYWDGMLSELDINNYRKKGGKKVFDYKFYIMPNLGGFGYHGVVNGYNAIGILNTNKRMPLRYSTNMDVDNKFIVKLYSLFTQQELMQLIMAHTTKRADTVVSEAWDPMEYVGGICIDSETSQINNILSLLGS